MSRPARRSPIAWPGTVGPDTRTLGYILLEDGGYVLFENSDRVALQSNG
jgi:hypothetical protein